jgi:pimeloyl-ACP methyl ester carboxylesterase
MIGAMSSESLLDHPVYTERCFFPQDFAVETAWVVEGGAGPLNGFRNAPHGDAPTLLHFHGNGEVVSAWAGRFTDRLVKQGLDVYLGEYRGYGGSAGTPALVGMLDDALTTADATGVPPERLVLYGRSIGSIYALHVAAHRPVAGLIIESGIGDVLKVLLRRVQPTDLGVELEAIEQAVAQSLDHAAKMAATRCPVLVMHAKGDLALKPENAQQLASWAGDRAELVIFDQGNHNTIHFRNWEEMLRRVVEFTKAAAT